MQSEHTNPYDALLVVSFGGPDKPEDVIPFLENVLRGKPIPRQRLLEVAEHYYHFGGASPLNGQNRALIAALTDEFAVSGLDLPIYWGNRNWHPFLTDTLHTMANDGVRRALAFFTSAYSSYSGCRQYREDIQRAQAAVGEGAPQVDKLRFFYNHPLFIDANLDYARAALNCFPAIRREKVALVFTAHSLPLSMARCSTYQEELEETARLIASRLGREEWALVYQSRSGAPHQPWLEPDVGDYLRQLRAAGTVDVVIVPIGFISDHMEVIYDLDTEAQRIAGEIGLNLVRASTVGTHPAFISMIRELVCERLTDGASRGVLGVRGISPDVFPDDCCLPVSEVRKGK